MTKAVQQILESFDALPEQERHLLIAEILRRSSPAGSGDVPESALVEIAEDLFRSMDTEEGNHANRNVIAP